MGERVEEKKALKSAFAYSTSATATVSTEECIERSGIPISTVGTEAREEESAPTVEPQGISARLEKSTSGTPTLSAMTLSTDSV